MSDIFAKFKELLDTISSEIEPLFRSPMFWAILVVFCFLLFMDANGKHKTLSQWRTFVKGVQKLINNFTNIFLDLFKSILDIVEVFLNFIKELSSLLFGSLHEKRAFNLAGFGVIFLSGVSFYTTAKGLEAFIGLPYNWAVSFGVQSAILLVTFKIIRDYRQRLEIKQQIQKTSINKQEYNKDSFFRWQIELRVRFKKCRKQVDELSHKLMKKHELDSSSPLLQEIEKLKSLFELDNAIISLFNKTIDKRQLDGRLLEIFNTMEETAKNSLEDQANESRMNAVDQWVNNQFNSIKIKINSILNGHETAKKEVAPQIDKISNSFLNIQSNFQKWLMGPGPIYRAGKTWRQRISANIKSYSAVESFRYSSGKIKEFYTRRHFAGLGLILGVFIFLSSTFSYTFIYNQTFKEKQELENYHMTIKLCDASIMNYQHNVLDMTTNSKATLDDFIKLIQDSGKYKDAQNAYSNYYNQLEIVKNLEHELEQINNDDPDSADAMIKIKEIKKQKDTLLSYENKKIFYEDYLAFIEVYSQTPFAKDSYNRAPVAPTIAEDGDSGYNERLLDYIAELKIYDRQNNIFTSQGLVYLTENLISKLSTEDSYKSKNWSDIRESALIYQNIIVSVKDFDQYQEKASALKENFDSDSEKSLALLKIMGEFTDKILSRFGSIGEKTAVCFCDNLYDIKNDISNQERFINENTAEVEKATTMLFSRYVPNGMVFFCCLIAVLIDLCTFTILFIRGTKNRYHMLDKLKVILAQLLFKRENQKEKSIVHPYLHGTFVLGALIIAILVTFVPDIPFISENRGIMFFVIWMTLYMLCMTIAWLFLSKKHVLNTKKASPYKETVDLVEKYFANLSVSLISKIGDTNAQIIEVERYKQLLTKQFTLYNLHIADDFRMLADKVRSAAFNNADEVSKYIAELKRDFLSKICEDILEEYVNEMCLDFLHLLNLDNSKEYGGYNYILNKALDKCNDSGRLFNIYYDSLYPTLLYIEYQTAVEKGFSVMLNLLVSEDLACYEDGKVYLSPLFFRIFDEILYLKMIDSDYDFTENDDIDNDLNMDDMVESYIEAKYSE